MGAWLGCGIKYQNHPCPLRTLQYPIGQETEHFVCVALNWLSPKLKVLLQIDPMMSASIFMVINGRGEWPPQSRFVARGSHFKHATWYCNQEFPVRLSFSMYGTYLVISL
jgi:hypothetical protein